MKTMFRDLSIRKKLTITYIFSAVLILLVNIFVYINVNTVIARLDKVYISNINLNDLAASLDELQDQMSEYLDTKSTDAMDGYYKAYQDYEEQTRSLSEEISSEETKRMERNIRRMSARYLELTNEAIEAKRGRNIEKYRQFYEEATTLHKYIKSYINSLNNDRFRTNSADYTLLSVSLSYIEIINIVVFVAVTMINVLLVILIVNRVTKPLAALADVAEQVADGNYDVKVPETDNRDETGVLNETFARMLEGIRAGVVTEAHLKDAQLKFLQAQINPHFLFNTLNAGAQLAMMEDADRTNEYIQNVADFFRYNMQKLDAPVHLAEELKMVDTYIYIINIRFSGEVGYEKEIDEKYVNTMIPAMILQPIVENAINHGIRNIPGEGIITIKVYGRKDECCIEIKDNGEGMTPEEIKAVFEKKAEDVPEKPDHGGIGLHNVIGRLKLMFGDNDVFEMRSEGKGKGTTVLLHIPLNVYNEEKETEEKVETGDV